MRVNYIVTIAAACLCCAAGPAAFAQSAAPAVKKPPVPRTADGRPDLSGVWQGGSLAFAVGAENAKEETPPAPEAASIVREPLPYQAWTMPKIQEYKKRRGIDDPSARCLMVGVPRITSEPMPLQIVQEPNQVVILYESFHSFRVIPTDGRPHRDNLEPQYLGDSVGHWEGNTLVVDVTNFNDKTWLSNVGSFHSESLHVTERYTRADYDTIVYQVTAEDPKVFTKPWHTGTVIRLRPKDSLREYECGENNEDILRFESILQKDPVFKQDK